MQVGVFSYYYFPIINGVVLTIADWKTWAKTDQVSFTICVPSLNTKKYDDPDVFEYPSVPLYKRFGITVPFFPGGLVAKELRRRKMDILHVHHPFYIGNLALSAKRALNIPLVFTYHTRYSDYVRMYLPWISEHLVVSTVRFFMVRFMNQCDAVTVANDSLKHELLRQGVRTPIFLVPPGVDTKKYGRGDRARTRKRFGLKSRDTALLYVGRLAVEKNIYFLMHAFILLHKRMPNMKLLLAGSGPEERSLRTFVARKKLEKYVLFADKENPDTISGVYRAADLFVYASQTETFGRVIVEAMSVGLPVVALAGPSIVDILSDGITGRIVFQKSPKSFAQCIIDLVRNKKLMKEIGIRAKIEAIHQYDSSVSWKKLFDVYQSLIA